MGNQIVFALGADGDIADGQALAQLQQFRLADEDPVPQAF